jgi:tetratricopeptide (TPR) repeat protein
VELDSVMAALRGREQRVTSPMYQSKALLMYSIGLLYLAQDRYDEAREAFAQAVVEDASQWYAHRGLGLTLRAGGRPAGALDEYRTALELAGDEPMLVSEYAQALSDAGQLPAAIDQLTRLVAMAPEWAAAWRALGDANLRAGRNAAAAEAFAAYLARAPRRESDAAARIRAQLEQLRATAP